MAKRIRVLYVIECGGPGGTGNQTAALCRGLDPERFEVHLAYAIRPGSTAVEFERLASGCAGYHPIPEMVREISPFNDLTALVKLWLLIRRLNPHIVHGQSSKGGFLARAAGWLAGTPRIYYSPRGYGFLQTDRSCAKRRLYWLLETAVSWIGEVIAVSESEGELARSLPSTRTVHIVPDAYLGAAPVEIDRAGRKEIVVCASGRMTHPRHPEAFARLASVLARAGGIRCVWIGDGELRARVEQIRVSHRLEGLLEITGWLAADAVAERLQAADIFVHYSRWEGLPNAVLEAMAFGLPVVASDIPGNANAVDDGISGYLAEDEAELVEHVLNLASDPELRKALGAAGRRRVQERFTVERLIRSHAGLYLRAAGDGE